MISTFVLNFPTMLALALAFVTIAPRIGAKDNKPLPVVLLVSVIIAVAALLIIGQYPPAMSAIGHVIH